jgi:ADP-ribose pyrophosphatase YjhB (NUDIX family)
MNDTRPFDEEMGSRPKLLNRTVACENQKFFVLFDEIGTAGRIDTSNYLVVAPKEVRHNFVTGVAVLPVCDGKIGLLRIYRHAIEGDSWEIPRGFVEKDESPIDSAMRELAEETGLSCESSLMKPLGFVTPDAGILAARVQVYAALRCAPGHAYEPAEFGHRQFCLLDSDEVRERVLSSEIQDPCTIVAYYRYSVLQTLGALC